MITQAWFAYLVGHVHFVKSNHKEANHIVQTLKSKHVICSDVILSCLRRARNEAYQMARETDAKKLTWL
jgi:phosphohistidine phosphatase SixA